MSDTITESTLAFQMRNYLVAAIKAEMVPGGRMATLTDVRSTKQFSTGLIPACGVQLLGWPKPEPFGQRRKKVTVGFEILLVTNSIALPPTANAPGRIANLDDATAALEPLVDDGAGNGLIAVLNDPAVFGLGGLASETALGEATFPYEVREGEPNTVLAYFSLEYTAVGYTSF